MVKETIMCQDNNSAILLENNGKNYISKSTKPFNVRFLITNRIKQGELEVN